ncbi:MAG: hypothetical protein FWD57_02930, partial [Polyangiaceae bacterium]|nr:hypothetical protein [Polyangiaceae bacterium]
MPDTVSTARTARESLARGLILLQSNDDAPVGYMDAAEPIARAMGALHAIEKGGQQALVVSAPVALDAVRKALSILQASPIADSAMMQTLEAVASSLGAVFGLAKLGKDLAKDLAKGTAVAGSASGLRQPQTADAQPARPQVHPNARPGEQPAARPARAPSIQQASIQQASIQQASIQQAYGDQSYGPGREQDQSKWAAHRDLQPQVRYQPPQTQQAQYRPAWAQPLEPSASQLIQQQLDQSRPDLASINEGQSPWGHAGDTQHPAPYQPQQNQSPVSPFQPQQIQPTAAHHSPRHQPDQRVTVDTVPPRHDVALYRQPANPIVPVETTQGIPQHPRGQQPTPEQPFRHHDSAQRKQGARHATLNAQPQPRDGQTRDGHARDGSQRSLRDEQQQNPPQQLAARPIKPPRPGDGNTAMQSHALAQQQAHQQAQHQAAHHDKHPPNTSLPKPDSAPHSRQPETLRYDSPEYENQQRVRHHATELPHQHRLRPHPEPGQFTQEPAQHDQPPGNPQTQPTHRDIKQPRFKHPEPQQPEYHQPQHQQPQYQPPEQRQFEPWQPEQQPENRRHDPPPHAGYVSFQPIVEQSTTDGRSDPNSLPGPRFAPPPAQFSPQATAQPFGQHAGPPVPGGMPGGMPTQPKLAEASPADRPQSVVFRAPPSDATAEGRGSPFAAGTVSTGAVVTDDVATAQRDPGAKSLGSGTSAVAGSDLLADSTVPIVEAELGAHSPTNFYRGLSGN